MSIARARDFGFVTARVRALKSFLLTDQDFDSLLQSRDENEALQRLASMPRFSQHLPAATGRPSFVETEAALLSSYVQLYARVAGWTRGRAHELLEYANRRFGYENLKLTLTSLFAGTDPGEASRFLLPSTIYGPQECVAIIQKGSMEQVLPLIEEDLHGSIAEAVNASRALGTALPLEHAVDSFYFFRLWTMAQALQSWDRLNATTLIGEEIDILNMLAVVRAKHLRIARQRVQQLLIPLRYRLRNELDSALEAQTLQEALTALARGKYAAATTRLRSGEPEISEVEMAFKRYLARENLRMFASFPLHVGLVLAYLGLKLYEISDVRSVIVGKSLGRSSEQIRDSLITYGLSL